MKALQFLFVLNASVCLGQTFSLKGTLIDLDGNFAVDSAMVILSGKSVFETKTDEKGAFEFTAIPSGEYELTVKKTGYETLINSVNLQDDSNLGILVLSRSEDSAAGAAQYNIPEISLSESDLSDESSQDVSLALSATRDAFMSATFYNWSAARFRFRGYWSENAVTLMNGALMNDLATGQTYWGLWGGLNDMMRNRDNLLGLGSSTFSAGGIGGATSIDSRASQQRKRISASYGISNRNYMHRLMFTYSTGVLPRNWALSFSFSRRWAKEAYIPGTFYDGYSYFASAEKLFGSNHALSITAFGTPARFTPTVNSRASLLSVQEMNDLARTNYYNPNWGYQGGEKRSAVVRKNHQPVLIATHDWKINDESSLLTAASLLFGRNGRTSLDWYNAPDPRPDYYRRLPSQIDDPILQAEADSLLSVSEAARQIDWNNLYNVNYQNIETVPDGIDGDSVTGRHSLYIVQDRVIYNKRWNVSTVYNNAFSEHGALSAGAYYQWQSSEYYPEVKDLLGGDFFLDLNQFAEQDFPDSDTAAQNDLNHPNRIVREGDKYSFDYILHNRKAAGWLQVQAKFNHFDFFISGELSHIRYWREGKTRSGLFPDNSFGDGEKQDFLNYYLKGGFTYKINGRNYLFANGAHLSRAPFVQDALVSARTRDQYAPDLESSAIFSLEGGYYLKSPKLKARLVGFLTQFNDQLQAYTFYHEEFRTQINYTLTNVDSRHMGVEFAVDGNIYKGLSGVAVASIGQYYYTSRPTATVTQDNTQEILQNETIYMENFFVSNTPQKAYALGLNYRGKNFWFASISFNVFDDNYVSFNPARRTAQAVELVPADSEQWNEIIEQEEVNRDFKNRYTLDLFGGKSWKLTKEAIRGCNYYLALNVGVNNITNNKDMVVSAFEQLRFDFNEKNPDKFATKYYYNYGATFFISLTFRMN